MLTQKVASGSQKAGGLLLSAYRSGAAEGLAWIEIPFGDLIITVATDAMKGPVGDLQGVRLPVSYNEAIELCRELDCISPTKEIADAMFTHAATQLACVPLVRTAADSTKLMDLDFTLRFHGEIEKQLAEKGAPASGLAFGAWKLWILHPRVLEKGAVNYGFWGPNKQPIQTPGGQHDARHYDYSQLFQPVKRLARNRDTGEVIDLLEYLAQRYRASEKLLDPYRLAPGSFVESFGDGEGDVNLVEVLESAGVSVVAADGWEQRGNPMFNPEGIMVHHTAGAKTGDAPTVSLCLNGREGLKGPLCHIVLARSGTAHVIAARRANHAGEGAEQVLEKVRRDEPIEGNAATNGYKDVPGLSGNGSFYGIEVENTGVGEEYPEDQILALGKICAALCTAHGWSAHRVIHHRQWTNRKVDMSYKGDIPGLVAQMMDTGTAHFGVSFSEEEDEALSGDPQNPREEQDEPIPTAFRPAS